MKYLSTFSGIGGMDLGLDRAGHECVGQVEIDAKARAVLTRHWPDVPKHDDITTAKEWASDIGLVGRVDLVCGGAPCQDLSVAGKREGFAGERSVLVLDMVALAAHVGADWILYENVPGLLSSNGGRDLAYLLNYVADSGFHYVEWRTLDAQHFGVPQRRRRVFALFGTRAPRRTPVLLEREGREWRPAASQQAGAVAAAGTGIGAAGRGWAGGASGGDVAAPLGALTGGPRTTDVESATFVVTERERERERPRLASSSAMQRVASTVTTGTGTRYDPDTESLVVT